MKDATVGLVGLLSMVGCAEHPAPVTFGPTAVTRVRSSTPLPENKRVTAKLLAINDFHGNLEETLRREERPVGGAAVLTSYLRAAARGFEGRSLILSAGDQVGGSPPSSGLLGDEPTVAFLSSLGNEYCVRGEDDPRCNLVATLGNHEFDDGLAELLNLLGGGPRRSRTLVATDYPGATYPVVCANAVSTSSGQSLRSPYVIRTLGGVRVGVIGAVTKDTPENVIPSAVEGLTFQDEVTAINRAATTLEREGVHAIVVVIHEGGIQKYYEGPTKSDELVEGRIGSIVRELDGDIDVVVSGHTHEFINAYLPNRDGKPVLVTQALSRGTAYADVDLTLDERGDIAGKSARIVVTYADQLPGSSRDTDIQRLVDSAKSLVAPTISEVIFRNTEALSAEPNRDGETRLGSLIADAQRAAFPSDVAMINVGGIRADLPEGDVTWGKLYAIQPFENKLVKVSVTGTELAEYLESQFATDTDKPAPHQVSNLTIRWDPKAPVGKRILDIRVGKAPLERQRTYTLVVNSYLSSQKGELRIPCHDCRPEEGPGDLDALVRYLRALPKGFKAPARGRFVSVK